MDTVAEILAWVVLLAVPGAGIYLFWQLHILPEKMAERRHHPQLDAIKTLCLLSLAFGGLLWPLAWLWAYTKPVLHRLAYGPRDEAGAKDESDERALVTPEAESVIWLRDEMDRLRRRLADLEARNDGGSHPEPH